MPSHLKTCLYSLNALNLNKKEWLVAQEVQMLAEQSYEGTADTAETT
jgi:hypothetical protein